MNPHPLKNRIKILYNVKNFIDRKPEKHHLSGLWRKLIEGEYDFGLENVKKNERSTGIFPCRFQTPPNAIVPAQVLYHHRA